MDKSQCDLGLKKVVEYLNFLLEHSAISVDTCEKAISSLESVETIDELVNDVQLVQESVAERYDVKKDVFGKLEELLESKL